MIWGIAYGPCGGKEDSADSFLSYLEKPIPVIPRHRRHLHLEAYEDGDERLALLERSEKMIPRDLLRMLE